MYKGKKIVALIPARIGSKELPRKNIYPLCGKPLIQYTIDQAKACPYIDEIVCSTDGDEIIDICQKQNVTAIKRPDELSGDNSKTIEAVIHALDVLAKQNKQFDYLLLLQPTSPLRQPFHLNSIIEKTLDNNLDSMLSVHNVVYNPLLVRFCQNDELQPLMKTSSTVRRQDFPKCVYVNGALYLAKTELLTPDFSFNDIPHAYEMDSEYSLDINTYQDATLCESILSANK